MTAVRQLDAHEARLFLEHARERGGAEQVRSRATYGEHGHFDPRHTSHRSNVRDEVASMASPIAGS